MPTKRIRRELKGQAASVPPDQIQLSATQISRLSEVTGISVEEIGKGTVAEVAERLHWRVDPSLFLFHRICGQVVKTDPMTGIDYPVPFATVHVEDTDCSFLGLFPVEWPWAWLFPIFCHREDITTVKTDECGHFCVWIPWFEIDWILRWRHERFCYYDLFTRPSIRDILDHFKLLPESEVVPPHVGPGPDPAPFIFKDGGTTFERIASVLGRETASQLGTAERTMSLGSKTSALRDLLSKPAFSSPVPPPIPPRLHDVYTREGSKGLAAHLNLASDHVQELSFGHYVGPFLRCVDVFVPEWVPILDVPDITFRVTQDVNGDGTEETIYSESYFDVRWNAGDIPDVTLHASAIALVSFTCDTPPVDCAEPAIKFAGLMPVSTSYLSPATGYAVRPNRPHPHGFISEASTPGNSATAPFMGTVQLYGCNQHTGASYYRLLYSFNGASAVPFTNLKWYVYPWGGGPANHVIPDAQGWYPILTNPDDWFPAHLLLDWPTSQFIPGLYTVSMELGNSGKTVIYTTPSVSIRVDNTAPSVQFTNLAWRIDGTTTWTYFPNLVCPVVRRPAGTAVEFRVSYIASAAHLRQCSLSGSGCGADAPQRLMPPDWSDPATNATDGSGLSLD
ncbi:MAG TPA: hypothetical protein VMT34_10020, partial [Aggregatilineales bacterium]|nr:hypothetical protein [Aggregatilineales bacterium]